MIIKQIILDEDTKEAVTLLISLIISIDLISLSRKLAISKISKVSDKVYQYKLGDEQLMGVKAYANMEKHR